MDRRTIVNAALALLEETGLDGMAMRRLATRLNVKPPALYWHFRDKQELLDEMARCVQTAQDLGPPRAGEAWRDWLARRARERREVLLAHRDGARLVAGTSPGPAVAASFDAELAALVRHGFTPVSAMRAITTLGHYVTGFVLEEQAELGRAGPNPPRPSEQPPGATLLAAIRDGGRPDSPAAFEDGLRLILDGIAASPR